MTNIDTFLARCDRYRARRRIAESYLSRLLFNDGKTLEQLREQSSTITLKRLTRAETVLGEFERALAKTDTAFPPAAA